MVGVGVAEGAGAGAGAGPAPEPYYGEYYPQEQYFVPPEMCPHPQQHPPHAHMCTMHQDYGGMPVVTSAAMMPQMMPPMDENMRHALLMAHHPHAHHPPHMQPHHQHHQPPPHHQPQHHYGPANGAGGPQHFYQAGYPPHFHPLPPHHVAQHSPPPPVYQKDERTQRVYSKLKQKLDRKQANRNNGIEVNSGASTPSLSPRKELNGRGGSGGGSGGASSGAWSEGEGSSAGASLQGDDENDTQVALDELVKIRIPQVSEISPISALVQWNTPLPEGMTLPNVELTYDLLLGDTGRSGGFKAIYRGPSLSCRVRDLRPGLEYSVCLSIRAASGEPSSGPGAAVTFRAPPAAPDRMAPPRVMNRTKSSLQLKWAAANDNGARVTHYILEMDSGEGYKELARPRTRQHTAGNLRPMACYRFRIAAVNEVGAGEWSEGVGGWTCGAPPPAPAPPVLAHAAPDRLALTWERRDQEEFTLQMDDAARGHGFLPVHSGPDHRHTCLGLRRATDYKFRLRAENTEGPGPWSPEVVYRTACARPAAPSRPRAARVLARAVRLRWEPPADDGGAPVETYTLELDAGEGFKPAYRGAEREATCERLQPGATYRARVRAANTAGDGEWSPAETVRTEAAPPAAPRALVAAPRAHSAAVRWRAPDCTGGADIQEYRLELTDETDTARLAYSGLDTECVLRELSPGKQYHVAVTAVNRVGASAASPVVTFKTSAAPPEAPQIPSITPEGPRAARLEWLAPADNGSPILDYRLEMAAASAAEDAFSEVWRGVDTQCLVDTLTPFSAYLFRVCACNGAGRGGYSAARELLTERAPPAAPAPPRVEPAGGALRLQWRPPSAHGADVLSYRVQVGDQAYDTDGPTPERLVEGLQPDTEYVVRVAAINELGIGPWSEAVSTRTRPPPPPPPALRVSAPAHNHLRLEWDAPSEGAQYTLEMKPADGREFRPVYRGSARSAKVKKLREATTYQFRIRASDERGGRGAWSEPISARTAAAPPPAPRAPDVTPLARAATVTWDPLEDATYVLQCAKSKDGVYKQVYEGSWSSYTLEELEAGVEYMVRVCYSRGGLAGAWSPPARLALPAPPAAPRPRRARPARRLTPTQTALLMAGGFLLVAVVVAVLLQRLVEPRP